MEIKDRVALVTGSASGIGHAVSFELAKREVKAIAMVDIIPDVEIVAKQLNDEVNTTIAIPFQGDVTDYKFREEVFATMSKDYGMVSICVPGAGITRDSLAVRVDKETKKASIYSIEDFKKVIDVNLIAPIYWAMEMIAKIAEDRAQRDQKKWEPDEGVQGAIVFIGSVSSKGNKGQVSYASTKSGIEGASATLSKEAIFHGVRCSVIHPGFTDTPMVRAMGEEYIEKYILPETQLGRLIRPTEIAEAICFMIHNSAVSGSLWADAGWHPSP